MATSEYFRKSGCDTDHYIDAVSNLAAVLCTLIHSRPSRGNLQKMTARKAQKQRQQDKTFWAQSTLALIHTERAVATIAYAPQTYNNTEDLGEIEAEDLDMHLEMLHGECHDILTRWICNAPDHIDLATLYKQAIAAAQSGSKCQGAAPTATSPLTCWDGTSRRSRCQFCPHLPTEWAPDEEEDDFLFDGFVSEQTHDNMVRDALRNVQPLRHPLDHAILGIKAIATLDHATLLTDHRHHNDLTRAAISAAQAVQHLTELPHELTPMFPKSSYPPYADALVAAVMASTDPAEAVPISNTG